MPLRLPPLPADPGGPFPDPQLALREPDGLLAIGGDLLPERLLNAYSRGIFPWYSEGQPILWWSPDPRAVFRSDGVRLSSRFRRSLRNSDWQVRADTVFDQVVARCANAPRNGQDGTWITSTMQAAYGELHRLGHAHSVEVFDGRELVGGIYGVSVGRMFFGESMFSTRSGGSKVALAGLAFRLAEWGWPLIDAQVENDHLLSLGAELWPRTRFLDAISELVARTRDIEPVAETGWTEMFGSLPAKVLAISAN